MKTLPDYITDDYLKDAAQRLLTAHLLNRVGFAPADLSPEHLSMLKAAGIRFDWGENFWLLSDVKAPHDPQQGLFK